MSSERVARKPPRYQTSQASLPSNLSMVVDKNGNSLDMVLSVSEFQKAFFSPKAGCSNALDNVPIQHRTSKDIVPPNSGTLITKNMVSPFSILSSPHIGGQESHILGRQT